MKEVIKLETIGTFPKEVRFILDEDMQKSILLFNKKEYKYDPDTHLPVRTGWVMCFQPASDSKQEDKLVVKTAASNHYAWAKTSVLNFFKLYPQHGGAYGTFIIKHFIQHSIKGGKTKWKKTDIDMDISVLPYLGNDLGFLVEESKHLNFMLDSQQLSKEGIVAKINMEYARAAQIRSEFSIFPLGSFNASNIIVSWDMQNIYIINQIIEDTDIKYERARLQTVRKKLLEEKKLPSPIHEFTPLAIEHSPATEDRSLLIDQGKYKPFFRICFDEVIIEIDSKIHNIIKNIPVRFDGQRPELNTLREFRNYLQVLSEHGSYSNQNAELKMQKKLDQNNTINNYISLYASKVIQELTDKTNYMITNILLLDKIISCLNQIISSPFMESIRILANNALVCAQERKNHLTELANHKHTQSNELKNNSSDEQKIPNQTINIFKMLPNALYENVFYFLSLYSTLTFSISCKEIYNTSLGTPLAPITTYISHHNLFIDLTKAVANKRKIDMVRKDVLNWLSTPGL